MSVLSKVESLGILQQSKASNHWSAPAAESAAFRTLQWITAGNLVINPDTIVDEYNSTSQTSVHREHERRFFDKTSGLPKLPFTGVADKTTLAILLALALQNVDEAAGTPFYKQFYYGGLTGDALIDWAGNGGYLASVALRQKGSADDGALLENALLNTLNLVWDFNAQGFSRLLQVNGEFIGNNPSTLYEKTLSGTWSNAQAGKAFYNNTDTWAFSTLNIDSVDYKAQCIKRVELQINNSIFSDCKTTGGKANQYKWMPRANMIIRMAYNSVTEKILKDYIDGARVEITFANNIASNTDGGMAIAASYGVLASQPKIYDGDYLGLDLNVQIDSQGGGTPLIITMSDTIDWGF
jgi:hypothetical protein